jgi:four helix bundle protein
MSNEVTTQVYKTFEDLNAYKAPRQSRKRMYGVARRLPDFEKFVLADQIRRAALSLANNIAEGHGRFHFLDQIKFMLQARGSLEELMDDLNACEDEQYLSAQEIDELKQEAWRVHKLINGYIRFLRSRIAEPSSRVEESPAECDFSDDELSDLLIGRFNSSTLQRFNE